MERTKFTKLCAFLLALSFLIPGGMVAAAADDTDSSSVTDKTIDDVREQLSAISYDEYSSKYANVGRAEREIVINGVDYDKENTTAAVYADTYDGVEALYTPDTGTVSWKVSIPETAKYSMIVEFYPVVAKSTSVQRVLRIDGRIPFAESRYITISKNWKNEYHEGEIKVGKNENPDDYLAAASAAGITAKAEAREDGTYILYSFPEYWTAESSKLVDENIIRYFRLDIDRNEIRNTMYQQPKWSALEMRDIDGFYPESFEFVFTAGEHQISLEAVNEPLAIKAIRLVPHEDLVPYEEYRSRYANEPYGTDKIKIEGEYTSAISSQTIYPVEDRAGAINSPTDTSRTVLNTIGGDKWQTSGQWVEYSFRPSTDGIYRVVFRFRQNILDGIFTSRAMYIYSEGLQEGEKGYYNGIPFKEAAELVFNYSTDWQTGSLQYPIKIEDEEGTLKTEYRDIELYFKGGVTYTVRFQVTLGAIGRIVRQLNESLLSINNDYLSILKLTGANPDPYRDYGFYRIMPDTIIDLKVQALVLEKIADELASTAGVKSTNVATLTKIVWLLLRMNGSEDQVARNLSNLNSYLGTLGTLLSNVKTQPLQLDYLIIQSPEEKVPKAKPNFFESFAHEISSFIMSFIRNYDRMGATEASQSKDAIEVWLATGRDQAQVVRNLINNDFTPQFGHPVNLKLISGATLLPSILAGRGPDVYIGLGEDNVINYAIRGALMNVENYEGFYDIAINEETREFNEAAMLVLGISDADGNYHYYGLPETQHFPMMFLRTDILSDLDIDIPRTWDDLLEAVPILQANNMQIGLNSSLSPNYGGSVANAPPPDYRIFLYQMGGTLFADDGMRINLDSDLALKAFEKMCNMFTMYSFPYKYDFANRFRTGEMPIGISSYTSTYNLLVVYATEIKGLWQFVPLPGFEDENGNIDNTTVSTVSAIVMIVGCDNEEGAWEFMKWHAGADCQSAYANEMVAILGDSAKHPTANIHALESLPWTTEEYNNVSLQFNRLASIPNYPGSYIITRYVKFAYLDAYNDNKDPVERIQNYVPIINKEIIKKRLEFDLEVLELGQTLAEKRIDQVLWLLDKIEASLSYSTAYAEAIHGVRYAIESEEPAAMIVSAEAITNILNTLDPTGSIVDNEIDAVKKAKNCFAYDVYKYTDDFATLIYYTAKFTNEAGKALISYIH
jgi:ABC-type glycerol-3-phosphate transport system substrate-binding protein